MWLSADAVLTNVLAGTIAVACLLSRWLHGRRAAAFGEERLLNTGSGRSWLLSLALSVVSFFALARALGSVPERPARSGEEVIDIVIDQKTADESSRSPDDLLRAVRSILDQAPGRYYTVSLQGEELLKIVPETSDAPGLILAAGEMISEIGHHRGQTALLREGRPTVQIRAPSYEYNGGGHAVARLGAGGMPAIYRVPAGNVWTSDPRVLQGFLKRRPDGGSANGWQNSRTTFRWSLLAFFCIFAGTIWKFARG
jgi:hypothetical protein